MSIERFDHTVQGAAHKRRALVREDAALSWDIGGDGVGFAVADGHGDPSCVRSALGSAFAVQAARDCLDHLAERLVSCGADKNAQTASLQDLLELRGEAPDIPQLKSKIVARWRELARDHFDAHPLSDEELAVAGERGLEKARVQPLKLYGTTLVAGLRLPGVCLLVQQGDGCCVVLEGDGRAVHPIPEDPLCVGNLTTSLSDADPLKNMRCVVIPLTTQRLVGCLVATDGVANALPNDGGVDDYLRSIVQDIAQRSDFDAEAYKAELGPSLDMLSAEGSGDDASVAGFVDVEAARAAKGGLDAARAEYQVLIELAQLRERLVSMQRKRTRLDSLRASGAPLSAADTAYLKSYDEIAQRMAELSAPASARMAAEPASGDVVSDPAAPASEDCVPALPHTSAQVQAIVPDEEDTIRTEFLQPPVSSVAPKCKKQHTSASSPAKASKDGHVSQSEDAPARVSRERSRPQAPPRRKGRRMFMVVLPSIVLVGCLAAGVGYTLGRRSAEQPSAQPQESTEQLTTQSTFDESATSSSQATQVLDEAYPQTPASDTSEEFGLESMGRWMHDGLCKSKDQYHECQVRLFASDDATTEVEADDEGTDSDALDSSLSSYGDNDAASDQTGVVEGTDTYAQTDMTEESEYGSDETDSYDAQTEEDASPATVEDDEQPAGHQRIPHPEIVS